MARRDKSVYVALSDILYSVDQEYNEVLFKCMSKAMRKCKKDVQAASPGGEEYRRGWAIRTKRLKYGFEGVIYNKTKPGLTHLLEKSHEQKNQYGRYERTNPDVGRGRKKHIEPAREAAEEYLMEELMNAIDYRQGF